jgi:hypothetical protein
LQIKKVSLNLKSSLLNQYFNDIENKTKSRNKMKLLNNLKLTDIRGKIINTKDVKIKIKQKILNKKSIPNKMGVLGGYFQLRQCL